MLNTQRESFESYLNRINKEEFEYDFNNISKSDILKKYSMSEAVYYKILKYFNIKLKSNPNETDKEFIERVGLDNFLAYNANHKAKETAKYFNTNTHRVCCIARTNGQIKKYKKENYQETKNRISQDKEAFINDYNTKSQNYVVEKWHIHTRKLYKLIKEWDLPSRSIIRSDVTASTNIAKYGVPFTCMRDEARLTHGSNSKPNLTFANLLECNNIPYEREFSLDNYSYDFKVNDTLIEINPTMTHSVDRAPFNRAPVDKKYHYNKTKLAKDNGYKIINIWDWDDQNKIIRLLQPRDNIYARNCSIKLVDANDSKIFIDQYHFQNYAKSKLNIGLYYKNDLVSIMTFDQPRYNKNYQWELVRYCSSMNVVGGAEKMFKYFITNYNPESIVSYCDLSKFTGNTYLKLGFKLINSGQIAAHWYKTTTKQHITDNLLRQRGFDQLFKTNYGKGTSNTQLMLDNGFIRVYDCGQATYIWRKENETKN